MENKPVNFVTLPGAVVIAGALIAIAIMWVKHPVASPVTTDTQKTTVAQINLVPVSSADHILGNPNAAIKIVEFSDTSCPYCKSFNPTMTNIMDKYGAGGKVAWVYRNYPLDKPDADGNILHKNAGHEAQALECAASLGGNTAFWVFEKNLYNITPSVTAKTPEGLDQSKLPQLAKDAGLNVKDFNDCLASGKFKDKVEAQFTDGVNAGVTGTPTSFIILDDSINKNISQTISSLLIQYRVPADILELSTDGKIIMMKGALPETLVNGLISTMIRN